VNDSSVPPKNRPIDELDSDEEKPAEARDTDRCAPPDPISEPWKEEPTSPGVASDDPFLDPRFLALLTRYEQGLDQRFASMRGWFGEQIEEMRAAMRQTCALAERAANAGIEATTVDDRLSAVEFQCARCARRASRPSMPGVPPNGNG
jgi:hypothetical protein